MGRYEEILVRQSRQTGSPLPERIRNKPKLFEGLQFTLEAFFDLDSERHHGNGLQRIPWSAILRYGLHYELDEEELEEFIYLIKRMDIHLLNKLEAEQKAKAK